MKADLSRSDQSLLAFKSCGHLIFQPQDTTMDDNFFGRHNFWAVLHPIRPISPRCPQQRLWWRRFTILQQYQWHNLLAVSHRPAVQISDSQPTTTNRTQPLIEKIMALQMTSLPSKPTAARATITIFHQPLQTHITTTLKPLTLINDSTTPATAIKNCVN